MQPKFTQRNLWYFCAKTVTLLLFLAAFNQLTFAQNKPGAGKPTEKMTEQRKAELDIINAASTHSFGPAPEQTANARGGNTLPMAANPVSRGWLYTSPANFQLNRQTALTSTALTPIGAPVTFGFPGAAAWVTTTNLMYVVDQAAPFALYRVDTLTGVRTFIANCTGVPHANLTGMTWDPSTNTMYGSSSSISASQIFTINITTGACTPIGSPTTVAPGVIMVNAAPGGSLFSADIVNDALYKWNKATGVPTLVGPLGFNANFGQDAHFDMSDGQYIFACYNATAGQPQMRIIDTLTGSSTLEGAYAVTQAMTLAIYTPPQPPCTGTPNPGNTISNTGTACPGVPVTLTLQNFTPGSQVTYQWQGSTTSATGPWTIIGPTSASWSRLQTAATWYRCIVTCVATGNSGTSTPVFVGQNPFTNCYCNSVAGSNADEEIFNVTFGTLNQTSNCATLAPGPGSIVGRYANYRTLPPATQVIGSNLPISITIGTCGGNFGSAVGVWIDMNQNGVFDHPAERIFLSNTVNGPHIASGLATIPGTALTGVTGMRVINVETGVPANITPCGAYTWGETEDYLINLIPCVPITSVTNPTTFSIQCSGNGSLTASAGSASLPQWQWEYRPNATTAWQLCTLVGPGSLGGVVTSANTASLQLTAVPNSLNGYQFRPVVTNPCTAVDFGPTSTLTVTKLVATVNPTAATICNGTIQAISLTNASSSATSNFASGAISIQIPDIIGPPASPPATCNAGISHTIPVALPAGSAITRIDLRLNITHTYASDLIIVLKNSTTNQTMNLFYHKSAAQTAGANFTNTIISSVGTTRFSAVAPPFTGTFRADWEPFPGFYGDVTGVGPTAFQPTTNSWNTLWGGVNQGTGNWTIAICDPQEWAGDIGTLTSWDMTITYGVPAAGTWTSTPAAPNTMFTDPAATVAYTGGLANTIYVRPAATSTYCVVYNTGSPACTSDPTCVTVNVVQPLTGSTVVTNKEVCVGGTTSFNVPISGGPFAYQWQETRDNGLTWANVSNGGVYSGATTATLTLTGVTRSAPVDMNNFIYRCNVNTAPCTGSFTSDTALLTVHPLPTVTITATDLALLPNQTSTITATSVPGPHPTAPNWSWTRNGAAYPGSTSSVTSDIDRMGVFQATVTDVRGCRNSSNQLLIEGETGDKLWLYPNPTSGQFQVRLFYSGVTSEKRRIQVFNSMGQEVMSQDILLSNVTSPRYQRFDINLTNQPSGTYLVKVTDLFSRKGKSGFVIKQSR